MAIAREKRRIRRHQRIRAKVRGTARQPRLAVFRSQKHLFAQLINDDAQRTIVSASDRDLPRVPPKKGVSRNLAIAGAVGVTLAERARKEGIERVVFDRGGFAYRGRVRAFAEGARKGGLRL